MSHIGTLREKPLHASLKRWCSQPGDRAEVPVDGYVIDLVRGSVLIEIQTRGFSALKRKLTALLHGGHPVRIVHPVAVDTIIVKLDGTGRATSRRLSPKHGIAADVASELVAFPDLLAHPGLEILVVLVRQEELRRHEVDGPRRRRGWLVVERRLVDVVDSLQLRGADDLAALLPPELPERFTTADIATALGRPRRTAQQLAYCLRRLGALEEVGKQAGAIEYRLSARSLAGCGPSRQAPAPR